jgi:hypothetical protein
MKCIRRCENAGLFEDDIEMSFFLSMCVFLLCRFQELPDEPSQAALNLQQEPVWKLQHRVGL